MSEDDAPSIFTLPNVTSLYNHFATQYEEQTKITRDMLLRVSTIMEENNINMEILNNMTIFFVNNEHISYQTESGKFKFIIDLHYGGLKISPTVTFTIKNVPSNKIYQTVFQVYKPETALTSQFMLLYRNAFTEYYR